MWSKAARSLCAAVALAFAGIGFGAGSASAQAPSTIVVDSIVVEGENRVTETSIIDVFGISPGDTISIDDVRAGERRLWVTGQFSDIRVYAPIVPGVPSVITIRLEEEALVRRVVVQGLERANPREVLDSAGLEEAEPFNRQALQTTLRLIQSNLAERGIPFARIQDRIEPVEDRDNIIDIFIDVDEGNRVNIAQVDIQGNEIITDEEIVAAMSSKPEGFWWFRTGSYDLSTYETDLRANIPNLYRSRGYLDVEILSDTLIVDPSTGKARVEIALNEGRQYRVASLTIEGNRQFDDERLERFFTPETGGLLARFGIGGDDGENDEIVGRVFDQVAFEQAQAEIQQLYANEGYIFAQVVPFIQPNPVEEGEDPTVSIGIDIGEGQIALLNRINIEGNDFTYERVIRDRLTILPGDVYSQDRVLQSYQNIQALGFFESPLPIPDIDVDQETGEVDVTFNVVEQQTGAVNFGTSVGGGVGLSGFIGYDQPNLFGQAKNGSLRWDFGRFINNFTLSYTDPQLFQTRTSGTIQLFNSRDRFFQFANGRRQRVGGALRFGFPIPGARYTSVFAGYSIARTDFTAFEGVDDTSLFGLPAATQSQITLGIARQTTNHPLFPTQGTRLSLNSEINGGILGGDGAFTKHIGEATWWVPIGQVGDITQGQPIIFALGTSMQVGTLFGDASLFPFDRFFMGGVQFGQRLRGYDETSITPVGYFPERAAGISDVQRLGDAFLSISTELAMRLNNSISLSAFFDAGNTWANAGDVNPTRLFRGAGIGAMLVTPFGPIGLDYAYGFDRPTPGWQLHFRMGPGF